MNLFDCNFFNHENDSQTKFLFQMNFPLAGAKKAAKTACKKTNAFANVLPKR